MDVLDLSTAIDKQKFPAGTVLFLQGKPVGSLMVLHSGMAELMNSDISLAGASPAAIVESSTRVGLVKGESVCGITGLYNNQPLSHSILTVSECIITNRPVDQRLIVQTLQQNMNLNLQVLKALIQRVESAIFLFRNYRYLWHKFALIQDSIALATTPPHQVKPSAELNRYSMSFEDYAACVKTLLAKGDKQVPPRWDTSVFLGGIQDKLNLYAEYDNLGLDKMIDNSQYLFIKRLLNKHDKIVTALLYRDQSTNSYIFNFLGTTIEQLTKYNKGIVSHINKLTNILYANNGWVGKLIKQNHNKSPQYQSFMHQLWKSSWSCHQDANKLIRSDLPQKYQNYKNLLDYKHVASSETATSISPEVQTRLGKYSNLLNQILTFSEKPREFKEEFTAALNQLKALADIHSSEEEDVALRDRFTTLYWNLYETCFLKIIDSDLKVFIPGIMLHFGLIDETMVTQADLAVIDKAYSGLLYLDEPLPAMTLPYFLEKIYTGTINPSISGMGESFREVLKRQETMSPRERQAADFIYRDQAEDKVRYEVRVIAHDIGKVLYGAKQKALPVLSSQSFIGNSDRLLLHPEQCSEIAQQFRSHDYSLFYREVVCKHRFGTDIVVNEVLPQFVIYPVVGTRLMMWQEIDGTKKHSPARFMLPFFFMDKFTEGIGTLLGQFRWEISRSVAGASWMDPVEGGMAGAYYDYLAFYKRNPKLSPTHKENIKNFIKKTRSDRERFASDYITWLLYEYEGKLRFNPVVRDIFYRFAPFNKEMREQLAKKPLYSDLETKRINRNNKEILRLESRYKRFEKAGEPIPPGIIEYMEYLQR